MGVPGAARSVVREGVGVLRLVLVVVSILTVAHATEVTNPTGLDRGFNRLYDLDFPGAQKEFQSWEQQNPNNPMGPIGEAAGVLFSEFNRLGVLEAQFYENDSAFAARKKYDADPKQRALFEQQLTRAETLGKAGLARDQNDHDALLAMTLASGLRADYAALIEKRSLSLLRRISCGRSQPLHRGLDVGAGSLVVAYGRSLRGQDSWDCRATNDGDQRPAAGAVCAHIAGDRLCAREGHRAGS